MHCGAGRSVRCRTLLDRVPLTRTLALTRYATSDHLHSIHTATHWVAMLACGLRFFGVLPRMHGNAAPLRVVLRTLRAALLFVHSLTATYTVLVSPLARRASHPCCCGNRGHSRVTTAPACGPTQVHTPAGASPRLHTVATAAQPRITHLPRYQPKVLENSKLPYIHIYPYLYLLT